MWKFINFSALHILFEIGYVWSFKNVKDDHLHAHCKIRNWQNNSLISTQCGPVALYWVENCKSCFEMKIFFSSNHLRRSTVSWLEFVARWGVLGKDDEDDDATFTFDSEQFVVEAAFWLSPSGGEGGWYFRAIWFRFFLYQTFFVRLLIYLRNYVAGLSFLCFEFWQQKFSKQRAHEVELLKCHNNCL